MPCGPFRRGRGGLPEELRQLQSEMLEHLNELAKCVNANETAVAASSSSSGGDIYIHFGLDTGSTLVYLPLSGGAVGLPNADQGEANWLAPFSITVEEVVMTIASGSNYGSTTVGTHIDQNGTAADTDTQTLDSGAAATFTLGTQLDAGQALAVSFDGQFNGGEATGYVRISR